jgi:flagellar biosynthesis/type III secretory pathway M-ring protein FliF/YscJ
MVLVTGSWRMWMAGMAVSLILFAVVFFTVIQPSTNTANQAVKAGIQQTQHAITQAQKQISSDTQGASAQTKAVSGQAQTQLSKAAKLTSCVAAAGTDVTKLQSCQTQFGH